MISEVSITASLYLVLGSIDALMKFISYSSFLLIFDLKKLKCDLWISNVIIYCVMVLICFCMPLLCTQDQDFNVDEYLPDVDRLFQSIKVCVTAFFLLNKIK